jgi:hypothetical protein
MVGDTNVGDAEMEDPFSTNFLARYLRGLTSVEEDFDEVVEPGRPVISQVEEYAKSYGIPLGLGGRQRFPRGLRHAY